MVRPNLLALHNLNAHFNIDLLHQPVVHLLVSFNSPWTASGAAAAYAATAGDMSTSAKSGQLLVFHLKSPPSDRYLELPHAAQSWKSYCNIDFQRQTLMYSADSHLPPAASPPGKSAPFSWHYFAHVDETAPRTWALFGAAMQHSPFPPTRLLWHTPTFWLSTNWRLILT